MAALRCRGAWTPERCITTWDNKFVCIYEYSVALSVAITDYVNGSYWVDIREFEIARGMIVEDMILLSEVYGRSSDTSEQDD